MHLTNARGRFSVVKSVDGEWGRLLPNGSTTGMIGMCQRNVRSMMGQ